MPARRPRPRRGGGRGGHGAPAVGPPVAVAALAVGTALGGLSGCTGDPPEPSAAPRSPTATPLASFDTTGLVVARSSFCDRVSPAGVGAAVGGEVASSSSCANGEPARLTREVRDVAHEFGCAWSAADGTRAAAWVFAPPVTRAAARRLRARAAGPGCSVLPGAPAFGASGAAVRCGRGDRVRVRFGGLFGDAWLSCEVEVAGADAGAGLVDRTGRWCVTAARAASTPVR